jgi:hypothetical protein
MKEVQPQTVKNTKMVGGSGKEAKAYFLLSSARPINGPLFPFEPIKGGRKNTVERPRWTGVLQNPRRHAAVAVPS